MEAKRTVLAMLLRIAGLGLALLACGLSEAAESAAGEGLVREGERGKWRISIGASLIGSVKPSVGVSGARMRRQSGFGVSLVRHAAERPREGLSRAAAFAMGSGEMYDGVRMFDDGAWFDPVDSGTPNDPAYSWNWRLHDPSVDDLASHGKAFVERTAYSETWETVSFHEGNRLAGGCDGGEDFFPGLRGEAAYELYRSEGDCPWGVEVAAAFAYYFRQRLWKSDGVASSATVWEHEDEGFWEWWNDSHGEAQYILDYYRDMQFHDGMWGAGSFDGPGAELAVDPWQFRTDGLETSSPLASHSLRYSGDGDYREYSMELIVRPWWEPWEWLRVFGSIGVEISRREFEWSLSATGSDGSRYSESGEAADWRALGLLGGGLALQWHDFVLAGEALWRFGGDDLEVSGRTVHGDIESGDWGFRLSLGYEF